LKNDKYVIPKSRYDSVDLYISPEWINKPAYNDTVVPFDDAIYNRLLGHGMCPSSKFPHGFTDYGLEGLDELLSKHIAHLFIRDPLVIFSETIHQDDTSSNAHFEVIDCWIFSLPCIDALQRTFNPPTGKLSDLSLPHLTRLLVGA